MRRRLILIDTVSSSSKNGTRLSVLDETGKVLRKIQAPEKEFLKIAQKFVGRAGARESLKGIAVYNGPGEFTQVRQGVAWANALSWALGLPVQGVRLGDKLNIKKGWSKNLVMPEYIREPNITKPRRRLDF
ncbi:hypothetical protein HY224_02050 [Candidatus Uhrbacteria bacterium]|nr:hypothetical protein [Candidatus Uhrbacteria bacterium]